MDLVEPNTPRTKAPERFFNCVAGGSVLAWAILGVAADGDSLGVVRVCVALINAIVGILFLIRKPLRTESGWQTLAVCLPSFVLSGLTFKLGHGQGPWPTLPKMLFVFATLLVVASLVTLGRSFAIFPALRSIVIVGPYQLIRHPIYFGEALLVIACVLAHLTWVTGALAIILIPFLALRIHVEERLLVLDSNYQNYQCQVKWRLCPGIW
ncbi:MAG: isoprenylcysteine carboxylmethyltransferase family protein [Verrucomicrobiota bacterium]